MSRASISTAAAGLSARPLAWAPSATPTALPEVVEIDRPVEELPADIRPYEEDLDRVETVMIFTNPTARPVVAVVNSAMPLLSAAVRARSEETAAANTTTAVLLIRRARRSIFSFERQFRKWIRRLKALLHRSPRADPIAHSAEEAARHCWRS